jgi:hypothetical protein
MTPSCPLLRITRHGAERPLRWAGTVPTAYILAGGDRAHAGSGLGRALAGAWISRLGGADAVAEEVVLPSQPTGHVGVAEQGNCDGSRPGADENADERRGGGRKTRASFPKLVQVFSLCCEWGGPRQLTRIGCRRKCESLYLLYFTSDVGA